jgi:hypothetical protein
MLLASIERLRALPRLAEIARVMVRHGMHDLVHSVGVHRALDEAGHALGWDPSPSSPRCRFPSGCASPSRRSARRS